MKTLSLGQAARLREHGKKATVIFGRPICASRRVVAALTNISPILTPTEAAVFSAPVKLVSVNSIEAIL
jgi:hypothetical protein